MIGSWFCTRHRDHTKKQQTTKEWELLELFRNPGLSLIKKLELLNTPGTTSPELHERIARETLGETIPATSENAQASLALLTLITKGEIRTLPDLQAQFISKDLTRDQAAFLQQCLEGQGRVNGIPVGLALNTLKQQNPELADNPAELLNAARELIRDWPEEMPATAKNLFEQAKYYVQDSVIANSFEKAISKHAQFNIDAFEQTRTEALEQIPAHLREIPYIQEILNSSLGGGHFVSEELDRMVECGMLSNEEAEAVRGATCTNSSPWSAMLTLWVLKLIKLLMNGGYNEIFAFNVHTLHRLDASTSFRTGNR